MNAETEIYPQELLAEDEPRYLRRQKPLDVRRRNFGRRGWPAYRKWLMAASYIFAAGWCTYSAVHYLLYSPRVQFASYEQIEVAGNRFVTVDALSQYFAADLGKSILRLPLDERRTALESIPWVEHATVERVWPNRIRVTLTERTPVAFLRSGHDLALVDVHGIILEKPLEGDFAFPVISGLAESMPLEDRERRMRLLVQLLADLDLARPGAAEKVSEVDVTDAQDLRVMLDGLSSGAGEAPLLVRFGDSDFINKYRLLLENINHWQMSAGRVESVDLRFSRQVVVNPETDRTSRPLPPSRATRSSRQVAKAAVDADKRAERRAID